MNQAASLERELKMKDLIGPEAMKQMIAPPTRDEPYRVLGQRRGKDPREIVSMRVDVTTERGHTCPRMTTLIRSSGVNLDQEYIWST
jgi:hypothetical protein